MLFYNIFYAFEHIVSFFLIYLKIVGTSFSAEPEAATEGGTNPALAQNKKACMHNGSPLPALA